MAEKLYTAKELAGILNCNPQTIYRMADRNEIESIKVGKLRRFLMPEKGQSNERMYGNDADDTRNGHSR